MVKILFTVLAPLIYASFLSAATRDRDQTVLSWQPSRDPAPPVNLTLYYESLCGSCHIFISKQIVPTWNKVKDIGLMTVELRPYGNAKESFEGGKWKFTCQHDENECEGNMLETCIVHHYPDTTKQLEIIDCVEEDFINTWGKDWRKTLKKCSSTGVDVGKISDCVTGDEGNKLQHQMAILTGPHNEVPWIILDGTVTLSAYDDLLKAVCDVYKGTPPSVCK